MPPYLLRCQGIAVGHYSFTLGRLEAGVPWTFAHLEFQNIDHSFPEIHDELTS
jgi:hypothetical protein